MGRATARRNRDRARRVLCISGRDGHRLERDLLGPETRRRAAQGLPARALHSRNPLPLHGRPRSTRHRTTSPTKVRTRSPLPDPPVAMASSRYPSSMGLTFAVDLGGRRLSRSRVEAAMYIAEEAGETKQMATESTADRAGARSPSTARSASSGRRSVKAWSCMHGCATRTRPAPSRSRSH